MNRIEYLKRSIDRITKEWDQHKNLIIGVDYDDTISPWGLNTIEECSWVLDKLKQYQKQGAYITINTACNPDRFDEIQQFCKNHELVITGINTNHVDLPYGKTGKIYANIYLDDRAGLHEAIEILDGALANLRSKSQSVNNSEFNQL